MRDGPLRTALHCTALLCPASSDLVSVDNCAVSAAAQGYHLSLSLSILPTTTTRFFPHVHVRSAFKWADWCLSVELWTPPKKNYYQRIL